MKSKIILLQYCINNGSTFEGRLKSTEFLTGYKYKAPILLKENTKWVYFPTNSSRLKTCSWLNLANIKSFYRVDNGVRVIFTNNVSIILNVSYFIFNNQINHLDTLVHSYILGIRNKNLTSILLTITNISSAYALIVLSILLLIIIKEKKIPLLISLNLICSYALNAFAKVIFTRPRPIGINLIEESGFSYPSGHSMISMAYYGFIAYLIYKRQKNKLIKTIIIVALLLTILLVGFSRIYLGVHYLSDVIGGFLLSTVYLIIYIKNINLENK